MGARRFDELAARHAASVGRECPRCGKREGIRKLFVDPRYGAWYGCDTFNGCGASWLGRDFELAEDELEALGEC